MQNVYHFAAQIDRNLVIELCTWTWTLDSMYVLFIPALLLTFKIIKLLCIIQHMASLDTQY